MPSTGPEPTTTSPIVADVALDDRTVAAAATAPAATRRTTALLMRRLVNPAVAALLRSPVHDLLSRRVALVEWTGRCTGRPGATPVNFAVDGDGLVIVSRRHRRWWRNLRDGAPVRVWLDGRPQAGSARVAAPGGEAAALALVYAAATGGRRLAPEDARRRAADTVVLRVRLEPAAAPTFLRGPALVRRWIGACAAGELLGFTAPAVAGAIVAASGVPALPALVLLVAAGVIEGGLLGLAQAWALRQATPAVPTAAWARATAVGAAVAWAIGMLPSTLGDRLDDVAPTLIALAAIPLGLTLLLAIGGLQARVLRGRVPSAWRWAPATAAAWCAGLGAGALVWTRWQEDQALGAVVAIGIAGALVMTLVMAAVTGLALVRMLAEPRMPAPP